MARPKKTASYDADDQTIVDYFEQAMSLKDQQKSASSEITALNSLMHDAGVEPGVLSLCCRLARMKEGKRGVTIALLHRYLQVLASRLDDPTVKQDREAAAAVPFAAARGAAAA